MGSDKLSAYENYFIESARWGNHGICIKSIFLINALGMYLLWHGTRYLNADTVTISLALLFGSWLSFIFILTHRAWLKIFDKINSD